MIRRPWLTGVCTLVATLTIPQVAHADVISPFVYFWPGVISITIVYAFPSSLLAGFVEEPFFRRGGVRRRPLAASLQANFLTTIVGLALIPVGYPALYTIGPIWCLVAFSISCFVELYYLRWATGVSINFRWIVIGNCISAAILVALPPLAYALGQHNYRLAWSMQSHDVWLSWIAIAVSAATFLLSFAWSAREVLSHSDLEPDAAAGIDSGDTSKALLEPAAKLPTNHDVHRRAARGVWK
ncbi:hypothetical protein [Stieleria maiorica]|uniref:hypothetical protein n=1 Tax=Stieleria maiorica TaxID=2795974 RepID=UPI0011CC0759|nr:hypothetical protein [Stieleria maiorica]